VIWIWTKAKNRTNHRDHGLSLEIAQLVFEDPLALSRQDAHPDGDRWNTIGMVGPVVLFVVHTWPEIDLPNDEEIGRIISARKATALERRTDEEEI
jgi:uncharacterized protein